MHRHRPIRLLVVLLFVVAAIAAITDSAWLGITLCAAVTVLAALIGARVARPRRAGWHHARTLVVLGSLTYLVGLPVTWLLGRHVDALALHSAIASGASAASTYLLFAVAFLFEVRRAPDVNHEH